MAHSIDALLERYLHLLDEYNRLREDLNVAQICMYQHLARANYSAERGVRFGQNFYDDRMQATRRLVLRAHVSAVGSGDAAVRYALRRPHHGHHATQPEPRPVVTTPSEGDEPLPKGAAEMKGLVITKSDDEKQVQDAAEVGEDRAARVLRKDPLAWFGLLAPMPLRLAQGQAVAAVEQIIPRLVSVNAEMLEVEIEVRRARKRRAKAETETAADQRVAAQLQKMGIKEAAPA
ncbi:hypothetical protein P8C59_005164 [Phyllachora maydis]|uniref:Vacuolar ATPase assembly protein VMA22 n=1 Tax=Phyllachora maydis TaxID=1825666 RepID=A0AAD9I5K0_9PEZI|nr:hypothetical protein P8C59_005164 [Phyllachora maydis]